MRNFIWQPGQLGSRGRGQTVSGLEWIDGFRQLGSETIEAREASLCLSQKLRSGWYTLDNRRA
jgi:hypothetical protein